MRNEYVGASLYGEQNKNKKHEKSLSKARNLNIMCKNICDELKSKRRRDQKKKNTGYRGVEVETLRTMRKE